jgi:hypothetical protein
VITDKGEESPYIKTIGGESISSGEVHKARSSELPKLGELAKKIWSRIVPETEYCLGENNRQHR